MFTVSYFIALFMNWFLGSVLMFFAGRNKETIQGKEVPKFILGSMFFTAAGIIPVFNLMSIAVLPLTAVYSMSYYVGYVSSKIKINLSKGE